MIKTKMILSSILHNSNNPNSIIDNRIVSINEDNEGNILIGSNIGICKIINAQKNFLILYIVIKILRFFAGERINVICKDSKDIILDRLSTNGLVRIDKDAFL